MSRIAYLEPGTSAAISADMLAKLSVEELVDAARMLEQSAPTFSVGDLLQYLNDKGYNIVNKSHLRRWIFRACTERVLERVPQVKGRQKEYRLVDQAELRRRTKLRARLDVLAKKLGGTSRECDIVLTLDQAEALVARLAGTANDV